MIYVSAVYADEVNTLVTGTDADGRTETVPADYIIFRCPDDGPIGFVNNGGIIGPYVAPEPVVQPPHLNNGGLVRFSGGSPVEIQENIRLGVVTRISKGRWRAGLNEEIPSGFSAIPSYVDPNPRHVWVSAMTSTYVEIRARDTAGAAADCQQVVVKVERVVTQ